MRHGFGTAKGSAEKVVGDIRRKTRHLEAVHLNTASGACHSFNRFLQISVPAADAGRSPATINVC